VPLIEQRSERLLEWHLQDHPPNVERDKGENNASASQASNPEPGLGGRLPRAARSPSAASSRAQPKRRSFSPTVEDYDLLERFWG
jgi:hypothetical protein